VKCSIDSFGILKSVANGSAKQRDCIVIWPTIKLTKYFDDFLGESDIITKIQNYRNYIIHHGSIKIALHPTGLAPSVTFDYEVLKIVKGPGSV
jgi:hypothetical protein